VQIIKKAYLRIKHGVLNRGLYTIQLEEAFLGFCEENFFEKLELETFA